MNPREKTVKDGPLHQGRQTSLLLTNLLWQSCQTQPAPPTHPQEKDLELRES